MRAVTAAVPLRLRQAGALLAATMLVSCDRREATAPSAQTALIQPAASVAVAVAGVAAKLSFTGNPRNTAAGSAIAPAVQVTALDGLGNPVLDFTGDMTVAIAAGTGTPGATLAGSATVTAVGGVATFTTLSIATPGTSYRLTAAATGLTPATSGSFFIAGPATTLVFTVQPPATSGVGVALAPAVRVTALDALGSRALGFASAVTMAITPGTGTAGATLAGTTVVTAATGSASFYTIRIGTIGTAYTLTAAATGLTSATSSPVDIIAGPATKLAFTVNPRTTTAGRVFTPAVQLSAQDAAGNLVPGFTGSVIVGMSAGAGTPGVTLAGTTTVTAVGGIATFATLSIATPGTGYTLAAQAPGLTSATSGSFTISEVPTALVFSVQPATTVAGAAFNPPVQVTALDAGGKPVLGFTGTVTLAITAGTGSSGAALAGTTTLAAIGGTATFSGAPTLHINRVGTGYTLTATATGLTAATSAPFDITLGPAAKLSFTLNPRTTTAGSTLTPGVQVSVLDGAGNLVPSFAGTITLAIAPGTGTSGAALAGTTTLAALGGVAAFTTLSVATPGTNYRLSAAADGLKGATSGTFTIAGPATTLVFTVEPSSISAGVEFSPAVRVTALDALGNRALGFSGSVTLAITPGTGASGASMEGTPAILASSGVATFYTLRIGALGTGYTLTATANGLAPATSTPFDITLGPAAKLSFTVNPTSTAAGGTITPAVQVTAVDAAGNPVPSFTGTVTVAISPVTGISGATLAGPTALAAVGGVATFGSLSIATPGAGYRLVATTPGLTPATSGIFDIN